MGTDILDKIKNSELLKQRAVQILNREKQKNDGVLDVSDKQIDNYLPKNRVIKDQEFLKEMLRRYITILEQDRIMNGGRLPDCRIEDLKLWTDPDILYYPFTPEDFQEMETSTAPYVSPAYDSKYIPKDRVELYITMKEAFFNISIEYLAKHYTSPVTPSNQDDYNKLVQLGIIKRVEPESSTNPSPVPPAPSPYQTAAQPPPNIKTFKEVVDEYIEEKRLSSDVRTNTVDDAIKMLNVPMDF
jgi:hypothetical protein